MGSLYIVGLNKLGKIHSLHRMPARAVAATSFTADGHKIQAVFQTPRMAMATAWNAVTDDREGSDI